MEDRLTTDLVFFGSGPVAARALELLSQNFTIEAVVTKPQPPHHRDTPPVIAMAQKLELKMYTPANKSELTTLCASKPFSSSLGVVIDYGIIIEQPVIDYFPLGIVNSHFSLLPQWRGADPISFAILSGQQQTGVSLMLITAGLDEGPVLAYGTYDLPLDATAPQLTEELIQLSDDMLQEYLPPYILGLLQPKPQIQAATERGLLAEPTFSRKLTKRDGIIDWAKPAEVIDREIRAFIQWPRSRTTLAGKDVIITKAHAVPVDPSPDNMEAAQPGDVVTDQIGTITMQCGSGYLCIDTLQPAGKNEMTAQEFLAGHKHLLQH